MLAAQASPCLHQDSSWGCPREKAGEVYDKNQSWGPFTLGKGIFRMSRMAPRVKVQASREECRSRGVVMNQRPKGSLDFEEEKVILEDDHNPTSFRKLRSKRKIFVGGADLIAHKELFVHPSLGPSRREQQWIATWV